MQVVVVESPGKVKSINKYLGPGYKVMASYGHIRDLPSKDGSVKPDEDFSMTWDIDGKSVKHVKEIADAVKNALMSNGVAPQAITVNGSGETGLLIQTPDQTKNEKNRRVQIVVQ